MTNQEHETPKSRHVPQDVVEESISKPIPLSKEDEDMAIALQNYVPDTSEEKHLVRKIDFVMLPCLWWMYILAYLDRGNIVSFAWKAW